MKRKNKWLGIGGVGGAHGCEHKKLVTNKIYQHININIFIYFYVLCASGQ